MYDYLHDVPSMLDVLRQAYIAAVARKSIGHEVDPVIVI